MSEEKLSATVAQLREHNGDAIIITTAWEDITGKQILEAMETHQHDVVAQLMAEDDHHEDECDDPDCCCHHDHAHHHHHEHEHEHHHEHEHEHHHHHDGDECDDPKCSCHHDHDHEHHHEHEHHHHHDGECSDPSCSCHDHHHHHADEVFTSWGVETPHKFTDEDINSALTALDSGKYAHHPACQGHRARSGRRLDPFRLRSL